jgi:UDP-N-acetylglucosamine 2-epimerase (non-hydrolysing)/UDP-GlcNAc3NAcA epimerase
VFPVHPRTRAALARAGLLDEVEALTRLAAVPPLGYLDFMKLLAHARAVLTDSGGVQKEAYLARVPCVTLRDTTEWTETVDLGWNRLAGLEPDAVLSALEEAVPPREHPELYGGGRAGEAIVGELERFAAA